MCKIPAPTRLERAKYTIVHATRSCRELQWAISFSSSAQCVFHESNQIVPIPTVFHTVFGHGDLSAPNAPRVAVSNYVWNWCKFGSHHTCTCLTSLHASMESYAARDVKNASEFCLFSYKPQGRFHSREKVSAYNNFSYLASSALYWL